MENIFEKAISSFRKRLYILSQEEIEERLSKYDMSKYGNVTLENLNRNNMNQLNEIKKALYKEKPQATLRTIKSGIAYYQTWFEGSQDSIKFEIPIIDMGDVNFFPDMPAHLLIRWIVIE